MRYPDERARHSKSTMAAHGREVATWLVSAMMLAIVFSVGLLGQSPDIDITWAGMSHGSPSVGANHVSVRLVNNGNGPIAASTIGLRFRVVSAREEGLPFTGGLTTEVSGSESFALTTLGGSGSEQTVTFTAPWTLPSAGPVRLEAEIFPRVTGDPDPTDQRVVTFEHAGKEVAEPSVVIDAGVSHDAPFVPTSSTVKYQTYFTPEQIGNVRGLITDVRFLFYLLYSVAEWPSVRIELGETTLSALSASFDNNYDVPGAPRLIAYDGSLSAKDYAVATPLTTPYFYSGRHNLLLTLYLSVPGSVAQQAHLAKMQSRISSLPATVTSIGAGDSPTGSTENRQGLKASFRIIPSVFGSSVVPSDVYVVGSRPQVGANTVSARIWNRGLDDLSSELITGSFSTDGGTTWSLPQVFPPMPLSSGSQRHLVFSQPWNVSTIAATRLMVRVMQQGGAPTSLVRTYVPDADIVSASLSSVVGANSVVIEIQNNGDFNLNGTPLPIRVQTTSCLAPINKQLSVTALAAKGSIQSFTLSGSDALSILVPGPSLFEAAIVPQYPGDPDSHDVIRKPINPGAIGITSTFIPPNTSRLVIGLSGSGRGSVKIQAKFTPTQVGQIGEILEVQFPVTHIAEGTAARGRLEIGETTLQVLSNNYALNYDVPGRGPLVVFDGPFKQPTGSSIVFPLMRPFNYSGTNNLLVTVFFDRVELGTHGSVATESSPGNDVLYSSGVGDVPSAQFTHNSVAIPISLRFLSHQSTINQLAVRDITLNSNDVAIVGANSVSTRIWNRSNSFTHTTPITLQYSTDGGATWPATQSQTFTPSALTPMASQVFTFATPWTIPAIERSTVLVRIITPSVSADAERFARSFVPDIDITGISTTTFPAIIGSNTIRVSVINRGDFDLSGASVRFRYSIDGGFNWVVTSHTCPPTLATRGGVATFDLPQGFLVSVVSMIRAQVELLPLYSGDPDTRDFEEDAIEAGTEGLIHRIGVPGAQNLAGLSHAMDSRYINSKVQFHWTAADFPVGPRVLTSLGLVVAAYGASTEVSRIRVELGEVDLTAFGASSRIGSSFSGNYNVPAAPPRVVYDGPLEVRVNRGFDMLHIPFSQPYSYSGTNPLLVTIYPESVKEGCVLSTGFTNSSGLSTRLTASEAGDTNFASYVWAGNGSFVHGAFRTLAPSASPTIELVDVAVGVNGLPRVGANEIRVTLRSMGTVPANGTNVAFELSTDGGVTWTPAGSVIPSQMPTPGTIQTFTLSSVWNVPASSEATIGIRINPVASIVNQQLLKTYQPDLDLVSVNAYPPNPIIGQNYVGFTLSNGTTAFDGSSLGFTARYSVDGGNTWTTESFLKGDLSTSGGRDNHVFSAPWTLVSEIPHAITVEIMTQFAGDPDDAEFRTIALPSAGVRTIDNESLFDGPPAGSLFDAHSFNRAQLKYQFSQTPEMLGNNYGFITEFGIRFADPVSISWPNIRFEFGETTRNVFNFNHQSFDANYDVPTAPKTVVFNGPLTVTTTTAGQVWRVPLTTPFWYSGVNDLLITVFYSSTSSSSTQAINKVVFSAVNSAGITTFRQLTADAGDTNLPANAGSSSNISATNGEIAPLPVAIACSYRFQGLPSNSPQHDVLQTGPLAFFGSASRWSIDPMLQTSLQLRTTGRLPQTFGLSHTTPLPTGLTLNPSTGVVSGSVAFSSVGLYSILFSVTDGSATVWRTQEIEVRDIPPPVITTPELHRGEAGTHYSQTLTSIDGWGFHTWSIGPGAQLPSSLSLNPQTGILSGTPLRSHHGTYILNIQVTDSFQRTVSKFMRLAILPSGASAVRISEFEMGPTPHIEIACTNTPSNLGFTDLSGWRIVLWRDSFMAVQATWDTFPKGTLIFPRDVILVHPTGPTSNSSSPFGMGLPAFAPVNHAAIALYDPTGNLVDIAVVGTVDPTSLVFHTLLPTDIRPMDWTGSLTLFSGNISRTATNDSNSAADFSSFAAGSPGVYHNGLSIPPMSAVNLDIPNAFVGVPFDGRIMPTGGATAATVTLISSSKPWVSVSSTGVITGTPATGEEGWTEVSVAIDDGISPPVTKTVEIFVRSVLAASDYLLHIDPMVVSGINGTSFSMPVHLSSLGQAPSPAWFQFVVDTASLPLRLVDTTPGASIASGGALVYVWRKSSSQWLVSVASGLDSSPMLPISPGILVTLHWAVETANGVVEAPPMTDQVALTNVSATSATGAPVMLDAAGASVRLVPSDPADINRDGFVDVVDVQLVVNIILALMPPAYPSQGDVNLDSIADVTDVQLIVNRILGP